MGKEIEVLVEVCREGVELPDYANFGDAGMDIYLTEDVIIHPGETVLIPTGIKVALPLGYELQVRPKSGRSLKSKLRIANTPGTIDAGYRDEIGIIADNIDPVIRHADMDETGRLYNILWYSSGNACHANILYLPSSHIRPIFTVLLHILPSKRSARITFGSLSRALAMAILCCSPPES